MKVKVERLSTLNKFLLIIVFLLALYGCATSAPDLPPDYGSVHSKHRLSVDDFDPETANLTCEEIKQELVELNSEHVIQSQEIGDKRDSNQTIGFFGSLFFLPAYLATDSSAQANEKITNLHFAKDKLYKAQVFKQCPP